MNDITIGNLDKLEITFRIFKNIKWNNFNFVFHKNMNHRCYCPVGWLLDIYTPFGIIFISYYNGEIPCSCDIAIDESKN